MLKFQPKPNMMIHQKEAVQIGVQTLNGPHLNYVGINEPIAIGSMSMSTKAVLQ